MNNAPTVPEGRSPSSYPDPYPGFNIEKIVQVAEETSKFSWELGTMSQALLELRNPEFSIFGSNPFPNFDALHHGEEGFGGDDHDRGGGTRGIHIRALEYAKEKIVLGEGPSSLGDGSGSPPDAASLGVAAILLSVFLGSDGEGVEYAAAAERTVKYLVNEAPRLENGAISHRASHAEAWADSIYMAPPFLAYYAVHTGDFSLLKLAVDQCRYYREILQARTMDPPSARGAWHHIIPSPNAIPPPGKETMTDLGLWATSNAWAAAGMCRVLATIIKAPKEKIGIDEAWKREAVDDLCLYVKEILDAVVACGVTASGGSESKKDEGLVPNYLYDPSPERGYGDVAATALFAATMYRMAALVPTKTEFAQYVEWAERARGLMGNGRHVSSEGVVHPVVNPLLPLDKEPLDGVSPEGQAFVVLMYASRREWMGSAPQ